MPVRLESTPGGGSAHPRSYLRDCQSLLSRNSSASGRRGAVAKSILLRSVRVKLSDDDASLLPLRLRPAFVVLNIIDLLFLGLLGFHPHARNWVAINDKLLHFLCFFIATALFYCIWDIDEAARRYWFWRYASLSLTFFTCFLVGGIGSEFVQSLLPYKTFQWGDVLANLLGAGLGLFVSYHAEERYRLRREIERLYQPLDAEDYEDELLDDDEEDDAAVRDPWGPGADGDALERGAGRKGSSAGKKASTPAARGGNGSTKQVRFGGAEEIREGSGDIGDDDFAAAGAGLTGAASKPARLQPFSIAGDEDEEIGDQQA